MTAGEYVLLDVDGVCVDYYGRPMPGIRRLVLTFRALGYGVVLWSAGGEAYCATVARKCGFNVDAVHTKPDYPIQEGGGPGATRPPARPPA